MKLHPGEYIRDELVAREQQQKDVAEIVGCSPQHLSDLVKGRRRVTPRLALGMARWLGTSAEVWLRLQNLYDFEVAMSELTRLKEVK